MAIIGRRKEIYYKKNDIAGEERDISNIGEHAKFISIPKESVGGNAMYRRRAFQEVGCFNPYLFSEEEAELSDRLKQAGYKVVGIPFDMVVHNTLPREKLGTIFQRARRNLHLGSGQIMRYSLRRKISADLFKRVSAGFHFLVWAMIGFFLGILSLINGSKIYFSVWLALSGLLFFTFILKSKSLLKPIKYSIL